jgi:hypothetical protein
LVAAAANPMTELEAEVFVLQDRWMRAEVKAIDVQKGSFDWKASGLPEP